MPAAPQPATPRLSRRWRSVGTSKPRCSSCSSAARATRTSDSCSGSREAEVRARARAALTELGGADPDRHVGLTDYLLGQADPIGRADASRHLRDDPADHELASELSDRLRELFPNAELPRLPGQPRSGGGLLRRAPAPASAPDAARPQGGALALADAAAGGSRQRGCAADRGRARGHRRVRGRRRRRRGDGGRARPRRRPRRATSGRSRSPLRPEKGSDAGGAVVFGFATADQPFIEFQIRNLEPRGERRRLRALVPARPRPGIPAADGAQRERQRHRSATGSRCRPR